MMRVASIGVAGESGVLYAAHRQRPAPRRRPFRRRRRDGLEEPQGHRRARHARRQGQGRRRRSWRRPPRGKKVLKDNAVTGQGLPTYGTQVLMNVINEAGALPTRNIRDVQFEGAPTIFRPRPCTAARTDGNSQPAHQPGLLRLHHRLRPHLEDRQEALHGRQQAEVLARLRRPRVRSGLGPGRRHRGRRPRGADLRQLHLQRARHRPHLLRRHRGAAMELYERASSPRSRPAASS